MKEVLLFSLTKKCTMCGKIKKLEDFYNDNRNDNGKQSRCKVCWRIGIKEWRKKNPDKIKIYGRRWEKKNPDKTRIYKRKTRLKKLCNITLDVYENQFDKQKGQCAICGSKENRKNQWGNYGLAPDHNHITKEFRGLLCSSCNLALGLLKVDTLGCQLLNQVILYLNSKKKEKGVAI